jgi:hypothetical protein
MPQFYVPRDRSPEGSVSSPPAVGQPPPRCLLAACETGHAIGTVHRAMTGMNYIESDIPETMTLVEWRRARRPRRTRRMPRLALRFA